MKNRVAIVASLGSTQALAWASSYYLPAVLAAPIGRDIGLSPPWVYAALSIGLGVSAVLGPLLGRWIDEHGGRPVLCGSNLAFAAGLCALAFASGPSSLILAWLVLGVAMAAGLYEAAFASLTRLYGHDSRGAITGITLIAGFASTVGWPTTAVLQHSVGWRGACFAWAALHLAVGLPLNAWALRYGRGVNGDESAAAAASATATATPIPTAKSMQPRQAFDRGMFLLAFMFTGSGMVSIGLATNLPRLFAAMGAAPAAAIAAASMLGPAQVGARVLEYTARHRINPLISARVATVLHPLASMAIAIGGTPVIALFSILHGAGTGMLTITRGTLPLAMYGPSGYGARIGRISVPARIGQAAAPFLFGLAIDKLGVTMLFISTALSLAALTALSWIKLPDRRPS
jgi:MFS family permease